ncbi:glutamate racemase [Adlercreutzia sp. ZJ304]|uniref:glutamate racemase n=1 Tax=Adlercreutzia sp. ZJ304 TaxID=2709791 RepID=UPI0013EB503B|nr:glutamate racemase [Adlercreutzia sp. ZJ304]
MSTAEFNYADAPIGVFDSGFGGLTVLSELIRKMPNEDILFVGDSARCPYGPRNLDEVRGFVLQICEWLFRRGCKLIIIACNTATAAGLQAAQMQFPIPIIGVVEPGARAAAHATRTRKVGVIATQGTVNSGAYERAIHNIDAGINITSLATPSFVEMVEQRFRDKDICERFDGEVPQLFEDETYRRVVADVLAPLCNASIDTLVLGCTHFPIIRDLIADVMGNKTTLVSSAEEAACDAQEILRRRGEIANNGRIPKRNFYTTGNDVRDFERFGSLVLGRPMMGACHLDLPECTN